MFLQLTILNTTSPGACWVSFLSWLCGCLFLWTVYLCHHGPRLLNSSFVPVLALCLWLNFFFPPNIASLVLIWLTICSPEARSRCLFRMMHQEVGRAPSLLGSVSDALSQWCYPVSLTVQGSVSLHQSLSIPRGGYFFSSLKTNVSREGVSPANPSRDHGGQFHWIHKWTFC